MAKVTAPCFSIYASGSLGKCITYFWHGADWKFHAQMKKNRSGKRSQMQIDNAEIFAERMRAMTEFAEVHPKKGPLPIE